MRWRLGGKRRLSSNVRRSGEQTKRWLQISATSYRLDFWYNGLEGLSFDITCCTAWFLVQSMGLVGRFGPLDSARTQSTSQHADMFWTFQLLKKSMHERQRVDLNGDLALREAWPSVHQKIMVSQCLSLLFRKKSRQIEQLRCTCVCAGMCVCLCVGYQLWLKVTVF